MFPLRNGRYTTASWARSQVVAQYGPDSYAMQVIGLKRKSERKRPVRKPATTAT